MSEIEFTVWIDGIVLWIAGSGDGDRIKPATDADQGEINLNAAEVPKDPDVTFAQAAVELLVVETRGGNDSVVAHGHGVRPYVGDLLFFAGNGNDRYVPGTPAEEGSAFVGDRGHDAFDISWLPSSGSFIDLRQQGAAYGPNDWFSSVSQVEEVVGHPGADLIYGSGDVGRIEGGGDVTSWRAVAATTTSRARGELGSTRDRGTTSASCSRRCARSSDARRSSTWSSKPGGGVMSASTRARPSP